MRLDSARLFGRALRTRWLVRAPIWLYRHSAGRLLGQRMLMIEHVGRTTGQPRFVCLEVVERPAPDTLVVASGFGKRAQWYRNLAVTPDCHVSVGALQRVPARARPLSEDEAEASLARYRREHPKAWRRLSGAIEEAAGHPIESLPMVELRVQRHPAG